jgi:predicted dehydrogenase
MSHLGSGSGGRGESVGRITVGLVGCGGWGARLALGVNRQPELRLVAAADHRPDRASKLAQQVEALRVYGDSGELIADSAIEAVFIATPIASHYAIARAALTAGKHVWVEKPLCTSSDEAQELVDLAARQRRVLMVDHTMLFSAAAQAMRGLLHSREFGRRMLYDAVRAGPGWAVQERSVLWDLASHDLAIMDYLLGEAPIGAEASAVTDAVTGRQMAVVATLQFASGMIAQLRASWAEPIRMRRTLVVAARRAVLWDELVPERPLRLFDIPETDEAVAGNVMPVERPVPAVDNGEPLAGALDNFAAAIAGRARLLADGAQGLRVVRALDMIQRALARADLGDRASVRRH